MTYIFESPDGGKTVYQRVFGEKERTLTSKEKEKETDTKSGLVYVPISIGELIDKLTILQIKLQEIEDPEKWINVKNEWDILSNLPEYRSIAYEVSSYFTSLFIVNKELWTIEDDIRECERLENFGDSFVRLARAVYKTNDKRAAIKKEINLKYNSKIVEEKSYKEY